MDFQVDTPIQKLNEDILGRQEFAISFAEAIKKYKNFETLCLGLYGEWGSGKTSLLNMLVDHLQQQESPETIVIRFDPWLYSNREDLLSIFFSQLYNELGKSQYGKELQQVAIKAKNYSKALIPFRFVPGVGEVAGIVQDVVSSVADSSMALGQQLEKNLPKQKEELREALKEQKQKIIIIIDDIDRLSSDEIRQLFQLVKAVGDFPNMVYLLAFDKEVVCKALEKVQEGKGELYLEKIIQVPFEVPPVSHDSVINYLGSKLNKILDDTPQELIDKTHFGNLFHSGIKKYFRNLRDVERYINAFQFGYNLVKGEVNPVDFMAVTVFQVFEPEFFQELRENKDLFTEIRESRSYSQEWHDNEKELILSMIEKITYLNTEEREDFLGRLFPKLQGVFENMSYGSDWYPSWKKALLIASPDRFDIYFSLSLGKNDIPRSVMERFVLESNDFRRTKLNMNKLILEDKFDRFLTDIYDFLEKIPHDSLSNVIATLWEVGESLEDKQKGFYDSPLLWQISWVTRKLLLKVESQDQRFEVIQKAVDSSNKSVSQFLFDLNGYAREHGLYMGEDEREKELKPESERTLNENHIQELVELAVQRIQKFIQSEQLKDSVHLNLILSCWSKFGNFEDTKKFVNDFIQTPENIAQFLVSSLANSSSHGMGDYVSHTHWKVVLKRISDYVEVEKVRELALEMNLEASFEKLDADQKKVINAFLENQIIEDDW